MLRSQKPYLIRALHEWCSDKGYTPYLSVHVDEHCRVPMRFVSDEHIILNISYMATQDLEIENQYISFKARFSGKEELIWIHMGAVLGIYPKEHSEEGMFFVTYPYKEDSTKNKKPSFTFVE